VLWPVCIWDLSLSLVPVGILFFENNPKTAAILALPYFWSLAQPRASLGISKVQFKGIEI
jgi:hypothetical protein